MNENFINDRPLLDAWQKSKKNLKHKIINLWWHNGEELVFFNECRVVSVNLDNPGLSIVTKEGVNEIIEGGNMRTQILRTVRAEEEQY
jgi:hypothetical protein